MVFERSTMKTLRPALYLAPCLAFVVACNRSPAPDRPAPSKAPASSSEARSSAAIPPGDAGVRKLVVGTWTSERDPTLRYVVREDGTLSSSGTLEKSGRKLEYEATWTIEDGHFVETVTEANLTDLLAVGTVSRDKVISIDESAFTYEALGERRTKVRANE
jgi:hypothetical protein